jgi:hypothetical protein
MGGKVKKKYSTPQTPYERVLARESISAQAKEKLRTEHAGLNPFELKRRIERKLKQILTVNQMHQESGIEFRRAARKVRTVVPRQESDGKGKSDPKDEKKTL